MEESLDSVEKGHEDWKHLLANFYGGFKIALDNAETALEGERIRVPDEVSDEVCDLCGRLLVIKSGRFGRFLACPGYPECSFTKPIVVEMPGKCPKCGLRILKRTSKNGFTYYACEKLKECGFMTWDVPVSENCPDCGLTLFKTSGRGSRKPFCINEACVSFLPADKRGYKRKSDAAGAEPGGKDKPAKGTKTAAGKSASAPKTSGRQAAAKKTAKPKSSTAKKTTKPKSSTAKKASAKAPPKKNTQSS